MSQQQPFQPERGVVTNSPINPDNPASAAYQGAPQPPKKKHTGRNVFLAIGGVLVLLIVIGLAGGSGDKGGKAAEAGGTLPNVVTSVPAAPSKTTAAAATEAPAATQPAMTASQEQAVGSAESYLELSPFSRKGLIRQLSSSAGDGFSVADATYAVDHIKVDWNEQAAKSARAYLKLTNFSRNGLIQQLESSAGDGFTHSQAVYGVDKAGL